MFVDWSSLLQNHHVIPKNNSRFYTMSSNDYIYNGQLISLETVLVIEVSSIWKLIVLTN